VTAPPRKAPGGNVWTCDVCGHESVWTSSHSWFGTLRDVDRHTWAKVRVACSDVCKRELEAQGFAA
jgi:hypothetical protein